MEEWVNVFNSYERELENIDAGLERIRKNGGNVIPDNSLIFRSLELCCPENVRVIIVGQSPYTSSCKYTDIPYYTGIAFSIPEEVKNIPPSLHNLLKELSRTYSISLDGCHGNLEKWSESEGILLLNASLTISTTGDNYIDDHRYLWRMIVVEIIRECCRHGPIVVALLGRVAQSLEQHLPGVSAGCHTLQVPHPAAREGEFKECGLFSSINELLLKTGRGSVDWLVPWK